MKMIDSQDAKNWLIEEIQNNWGKEAREGIHVTDTLTPRRKFFQEIEPSKATIEEILTWLPGIEFESRIKRAMGFETPKVGIWEGIYYSIDVAPGNFPVEIKMRRRQLASADSLEDTYEWYSRQLKAYCAILGIPKGWLIVFTPVQKDQSQDRTYPDFHVIDVQFEKEELEEERIRLKNTKMLIEQALIEKDVSLLPYCPEWICYRAKKILVKSPYCKTCKREFKTDWGIERHYEATEHEIVFAEYALEKEPRCKYYEKCKQEKSNG